MTEGGEDMPERDSYLWIMKDSGYFSLSRGRNNMPEGFAFNKNRSGGGIRVRGNRSEGKMAGYSAANFGGNKIRSVGVND